MGARPRIGLNYTYNENWIGGTYYIENLISAFNALNDNEKPHIVLITDTQKDYKAAKRNLVYPFISFQLGSGESNRFFQLVNKVMARSFGRTIFRQKIRKLDAMFPYYPCVQQSLAKRKIYWIADFQEHFITDFSTDDFIDSRKKSQLEIQSSTENLVLSSYDALAHFKQLYSQHTVKVNVIPFAVTHPGYSHLIITDLLGKFGLKQPYFICPNQFWKHKNQIVVLKAICQLKDQGINVTVAFTGKAEDYRNPGYYEGLKNFVKEHQLDAQTKFLGFINRSEQLQLMKNSLAIIQPSLFEGWSTVVEDAKAMNKSLIVSDISVHKEQLLYSSALFFDPLNASDLSSAMERALNMQTLPPLFENYSYDQNVKEFGRKFLKILC